MARRRYWTDLSDEEWAILESLLPTYWTGHHMEHDLREIVDDILYFTTGFTGLIAKAKEAGEWNVPKDHVTVKTGLLPGEININATRVQGNALDERVLSNAEIAIRKQAYHVFDFFKKYVPGFEQAALMDIAPKIGCGKRVVCSAITY